MSTPKDILLSFRTIATKPGISFLYPSFLFPSLREFLEPGVVLVLCLKNLFCFRVFFFTSWSEGSVQGFFPAKREEVWCSRVKDFQKITPATWRISWWKKEKQEKEEMDWVTQTHLSSFRSVWFLFSFSTFHFVFLVSKSSPRSGSSCEDSAEDSTWEQSVQEIESIAKYNVKELSVK